VFTYRTDEMPAIETVKRILSDLKLPLYEWKGSGEVTDYDTIIPGINYQVFNNVKYK
jgi:hypothetical protein